MSLYIRSLLARGTMQCLRCFNLSRLMTKPAKWLCAQRRLRSDWASAQADQSRRCGIRPGWSESSLCAQWVAKDPSFLRADSEDSDQTGRIPRLIWVFAGCTCHFAGFVMRRLIFYGVSSAFILYVEAVIKTKVHLFSFWRRLGTWPLQH